MYTNEQVAEMIDKAEAASARPEAIAALRRLRSWRRIIKDKRAPWWLFWYAREVSGRWPETEVVIRQDAACAYWYGWEFGFSDRDAPRMEDEHEA